MIRPVRARPPEHFGCHGIPRDEPYSDIGVRRRIQYAVGAAAPADPRVDRRTGGQIVAVIIIIVTGLTLAFGDTGGGFRRLIQIVFGLSIAFAASSFFLTFFTFGGGALV